MKRTLLCVMLLSTIIVAKAQPVLQSANATIGKTFTLYQIGNISPTTLANSGANISWSTTSGTPSLLGEGAFISPSETPFGSSYPDANFCLRLATATDTIYHLFKNSSAGMEEVATDLRIGSGSIFTNYRLFMPASFSFNGVETDTYQKTGDATETATLTYDAWGTLATSDSTYTNLGRVYRSTTASNINVAWWAENGAYPVLVYDGNMLLYFKPKSSTTIGLNNGITRTDHTVKLFPNPASDFIKVSSENIITEINLISAEGKSLASIKHHEINVSEFNPGVYFIRVQTNRGSSTNKFIKY